MNKDIILIVHYAYYLKFNHYRKSQTIKMHSNVYLLKIKRNNKNWYKKKSYEVLIELIFDS